MSVFRAEIYTAFCLTFVRIISSKSAFPDPWDNCGAKFNVTPNNTAVMLFLTNVGCFEKKCVYFSAFRCFNKCFDVIFYIIFNAIITPRTDNRWEYRFSNHEPNDVRRLPLNGLKAFYRSIAMDSIL